MYIIEQVLTYVLAMRCCDADAREEKIASDGRSLALSLELQRIKDRGGSFYVCDKSGKHPRKKLEYESEQLQLL